MKIFHVAQVTLLSLAIIFPSALQFVKTPIFILLLALSLSHLQVGYYKIPRTNFLIAVWYSIIGLLYIFLGYLNGGKVTSLVPMYVFYPFLFTILAAGWSNEIFLFSIPKIMEVGCIVVVIYLFDNFLYQMNFTAAAILPQPYKSEDYGVRIEAWEFEFSGRQLSSMLYIVPYLTAYSVLTVGWGAKSLNSKVLKIIILLGSAISVLVGRRAIVISLLCSYAVLGAFIILLPWAIRLKLLVEYLKTLMLIFLFLLISLSALEMLGFISVRDLVEQFMSGFDFESDRSANARSLQFKYLLEEWQESRMFGYGHGTSLANGYLRSTTHPWSYELSYIALLFHVGIIGVIGYSAGLIWLLVKSVAIVRRGNSAVLILIPAVVGLCSILVANVSNPYLEKFDSIILIFIPIAIIVYVENNRKLLTSAPFNSPQALIFKNSNDSKNLLGNPFGLS